MENYNGMFLKIPNVYFAYSVAPPKTVVVHQEYLIYDTIGLMVQSEEHWECLPGTISQIITYLSMLRSRLFD